MGSFFQWSTPLKYNFNLTMQDSSDRKPKISAYSLSHSHSTFTFLQVICQYPLTGDFYWKSPGIIVDFWARKVFDPNKVFDSKISFNHICLTPKHFWPQKCFWPKIVLTKKNFFDPKICFDPTFFLVFFTFGSFLGHQIPALVFLKLLAFSEY